MKRVLVAGSTGYLGGFVTKELKNRKHFVRALARNPQKLPQCGIEADEVFKAEITRPDTLRNVCDSIDVVFSSIGITRQKDGLTFRDVDYQGNLNLLEEALRAGVKKFVYVSVFNGPLLRDMDIVSAHEDFVDKLKASGINYAVLRPTGYFSDMLQFLEMARKGRVYLIGKGLNSVNPIHGADLAVQCADALEGRNQEIDVGGPEIFTYREIAELAFRAIGNPARITVIPPWLLKALTSVVKVFSPHQGGLLEFFAFAMTSEVVAPGTGSHLLGTCFREHGNEAESEEN